MGTTSLTIPSDPSSALATLPAESADFCKALYQLDEAGGVLHMMTTCARFVLGMELSAAKNAFGETRGRKTDNVSVFKTYGEWVKEEVGFSERQARRFVALVEALREGRGQAIGLPASLFPEVQPSELSAEEREKLFRKIAQAVGTRSFFQVASELATIAGKSVRELTEEERNKTGRGDKKPLTDEEVIADAVSTAAKPLGQLEFWLGQGNHSKIPTMERRSLIERLESLLAELKSVGA